MVDDKAESCAKHWDNTEVAINSAWKNCSEGDTQPVARAESGEFSSYWVSEATGTKVLRGLSESRSHIVTGHVEAFRQCFQTPGDRCSLGGSSAYAVTGHSRKG